MRRILITAVALALTATLDACGSIASTPTASTDTSQPAAATTTNSAAAAAAGIYAWYTGGGQTDVSQFVSEAGDISTAASSQDLSTLKTACTDLQTTVENAQAYKQIPDAQAQTPWAQALAQYARGASDCIAGIESGDDSVVTKSAGELTAGTSYLNQVTARIKSLDGQG